MNKTDVAVLRLTLSGASVWMRDGGRFSNGGGIVTDAGTLSDAVVRESAEALRKKALVSATESPHGKETLIRYTITDKGRRELRRRDGRSPLTVDAARQLHDSDLQSYWSDDPSAKQVLSGRARVSQQLRLVLARVYGRPGMATFSQWTVIPCLTGDGTIGILDIAAGTAWDTGVIADSGVHDLGLEDVVYAAANNGLSGTVYFDGMPVQSECSAVDSSGNVIPPKMPDGWRQIALPSWRGYEDSRSYNEVPTELYRPEHWIRPRLVQAHLITCYGRPGTEDGRFLARCHGWESAYPWGVPEWIDGTSVTVLDTIADGGAYGGNLTRWPRSRLPRGTDSEEIDRVRSILPFAREVLRGSIRRALGHVRDVAARGTREAQVAQRAEAALRQALESLPAVLPPPEIVRLMDEYRIAGAAHDSWEVASCSMAIRRCEEFLDRGLPWDAARCLSCSFASEIYHLLPFSQAA